MAESDHLQTLLRHDVEMLVGDFLTFLAVGQEEAQQAARDAKQAAARAAALAASSAGPSAAELKVGPSFALSIHLDALCSPMSSCHCALLIMNMSGAIFPRQLRDALIWLSEQEQLELAVSRSFLVTLHKEQARTSCYASYAMKPKKVLTRYCGTSLY